jgi:hypothetical protein
LGYNIKNEAKTETSEMKFVICAAGYTRKGQKRNTKIRK